MSQEKPTKTTADLPLKSEKKVITLFGKSFEFPNVPSEQGAVTPPPLPETPSITAPAAGLHIDDLHQGDEIVDGAGNRLVVLGNGESAAGRYVTASMEGSNDTVRVLEGSLKAYTRGEPSIPAAEKSLKKTEKNQWGYEAGVMVKAIKNFSLPETGTGTGTMHLIKEKSELKILVVDDATNEMIVQVVGESITLRSTPNELAKNVSTPSSTWKPPVKKSAPLSAQRNAFNKGDILEVTKEFFIRSGIDLVKHTFNVGQTILVKGIEHHGGQIFFRTSSGKKIWTTTLNLTELTKPVATGKMTPSAIIAKKPANTSTLDELQLARQKLKDLGIKTLSVRPSGQWMNIRVAPAAQKQRGSGTFSPDEQAAIRSVFGGDVGTTNSYVILQHEARMIFGMEPKRPICHSCGQIWNTYEEAENCPSHH
jgi:hypothetical protein